MIKTVPLEETPRDEDYIHPQYDVAMHIDQLFTVPVYRNPENPLIESWRVLGERLLALGEHHLEEGVEAAGTFLQEKLDARPKRRRSRPHRGKGPPPVKVRTRSKPKAKPAATEAASAEASTTAASTAAASAT